MKLSFTAFAAVMSLALSVSAVPPFQVAGLGAAGGAQNPTRDRIIVFSDEIGTRNLGNLFSDTANFPLTEETIKVKSICVTAGARIEHIQIVFSTASGGEQINSRGIEAIRPGVTKSTINLAPNEIISSLSIAESSGGIVGLLIRTSGGQELVAGTTQGVNVIPIAQPRDPRGTFGLVGFMGHLAIPQGTGFDGLGAIWGLNPFTAVA